MVKIWPHVVTSLIIIGRNSMSSRMEYVHVVLQLVHNTKVTTNWKMIMLLVHILSMEKCDSPLSYAHSPPCSLKHQLAIVFIDSSVTIALCVDRLPAKITLDLMLTLHNLQSAIMAVLQPSSTVALQTLQYSMMYTICCTTPAPCVTDNWTVQYITLPYSLYCIPCITT